MTAEHETECGYEQRERAEWEALAARIEEGHDRLFGAERPAPPYKVERVPTTTPGTGRYRITKADGTVYYVSYGSAGMHCTCPDARHRNQGKCKHCRNIALFIGRPELVKES